ncbi:RING-H2 finger protein ATL5M precursor, putative [Ricinus communis]|uniref:RING-type E3 ubiquitin transferase n=2 Tax=Ricinus communis TaxID=3988 RepID=B9RYZ5_RICCO|nr:RING-H2 finger protein ATL5M precursor, putative [Ricinus communis]
MAAASANLIHLSPPPPHAATSCNPHAHGCRWWPYSKSNDFGANTAMILIILLCALICALVLNTAIRCFLRSAAHPPDRLPQTQRELDDHRKPNTEASASPLVVAPTVVYSAGMKLGGAEADCAICLSEFVEGEGIRVLGSCKHGFHVHCIEQWLSCHPSCPTCRRSCLAPGTSVCWPENDLNNASQPPPNQIAQDHNTNTSTRTV